MTHFYMVITYWTFLILRCIVVVDIDGQLQASKQSPTGKHANVWDCAGDQGSVNELCRSREKSVHEANIS